MMKTVLAVAIAVSAIAPVPANAQFGGLLNRGGQESNAPDAKAFLDSFVESYTQVVTAQIHFSEALGLKEQVDLLKAEQQALGSGSIDSDRLEKVSEVSANAQRAINERQEAQPQLDASAKQAYGKGLISLFEGIMTGRDVVRNAEAVGSSLGSNPMSMAGSGRTAAYVVKAAPEYLRGLQQSGKLAIEFGRDNGIEAPSNATGMLEGM